MDATNPSLFHRYRRYRTDRRLRLGALESAVVYVSQHDRKYISKLAVLVLVGSARELEIADGIAACRIPEADVVADKSEREATTHEEERRLQM